MKRQKINAPPSIMIGFFRWFCRAEYQEDIEGDLYEKFEQLTRKHNTRKAHVLFTVEIFKLLRMNLIQKFKPHDPFNRFGMFKNYLTTALRNIRKEKMFAFMNIAGLAIGIGCALVIYQIITFENSFDQYHRHHKDIYRLVSEYKDPEKGTQIYGGQVHPIGEALRNDFAGVEAVMTFYAGEGQVAIESKDGKIDRYQEKSGLTYAEPGIFRIFDFDFLAGDPASALVNPSSVVITITQAQKYFGIAADEGDQALGKTLTINNKTIFTVTGVIVDTPRNTDLPFTIIGDYKNQTASNPYFQNGTDWQEYNSGTNCYLLTTDRQSLEKNLPSFYLKYNKKEQSERQRYALQPLSDLHTSKAMNYNERTVSPTRLQAMAVIAAFLIITASINFINLSTAQAIKRSREIGVRKTLGSLKRQLVLQFLGETILISSIAALGGLLIAFSLFQYLDGILGYHLTFNIFNSPANLVLMAATVLGVGLISGFYPAMVMARMNPVLALKNALTARSTSGLLSVRRSLVVAQFMISQLLIIGTIVVHLQMDYFLGKDLGFDKDAVLVTNLPDAKLAQLDVLKTSLLKYPGVEMVSFGARSPLSDWRMTNPINHPNLEKDKHSGNLKTADENYLALYKLKLIAGRNFSAEKDNNDAVVNLGLTQLLGFKEPADALGEKFKYARWEQEFTIVGVVADVHTVNLKKGMENVIFSNLSWNIKEMAVKFTTVEDFSEARQTIENIQAEWTKVFPEVIFDFTFLDERIGKMYEDEARTAQLFELFALVAIFIGCLGLYGLVSYIANQRTKEIGIRKVLGASIFDILGIFSREMLALIGVAFFIAGPIGYLAMNSWLQNFAYRMPFSPFILVLAVTASALIAMATIGYRSVRASLVNPTESLKSE